MRRDGPDKTRGGGVAGEGPRYVNLSLPEDKDTLCLWDGRGGRGRLRTAAELELFVSTERCWLWRMFFFAAAAITALQRLPLIIPLHRCASRGFSPEKCRWERSHLMLWWAPLFAGGRKKIGAATDWLTLSPCCQKYQRNQQKGATSFKFFRSSPVWFLQSQVVLLPLYNPLSNQ